MAGYWQTPCPARGAALPHSHWSKCGEDGHPNDGSPVAGHMHAGYMCCHCEKTEAMYRQEEMYGSGEAPTVEEATITDEGATPPHCPQDHKALVPLMLTGNDMQQWAHCPACKVQVEPKKATGKVEGYEFGKGRGPLTEHQREQITTAFNREDFADWMEAGRPPLELWFGSVE